jgi:flagellar M-ring protein FliF
VQTMRGISAARVHIVLPDQSGLARDRQKPTASVIIRTDGLTPAETARTIRHIVAAAVPGLTVEAVTISDTEGSLLAGEGDANPNGTALFGLERTVAASVEQNIRRALQPVVGTDNFRISVAARLNSDKRQISETVYDPDGRVERSQRVTRAEETSTNSDGAAPATVTEEMAEDEVGDIAATTNSEANERREEQTDFALSSRTTATVSDGYKIEALSIAVVVNRASFGADTVPQAEIDTKLAEIKALLSAASGYDEERGDKLTLSAMAFASDAIENAEAEGFDAMAFVSANMGSLIRAVGFVAVVLIAIQLGLRPALRAFTQPSNLIATSGATDLRLAAPDAAAKGHGAEDPAADVAAKLESTARKRLERIVELDEDKAVAVLKHWLNAKPDAA